MLSSLSKNDILMKKIFTFLLLSFIAIPCFAQVAVNPSIECPPCRPIFECGQCWETQEQADDCQKSAIFTTKESTDIQFTVTPSPIRNGSFTVTATKRIVGKMIIINQIGAIIHTETPNNTATNFKNIQLNVEKGLYFLIYYNPDNQTKTTTKLLFTD